MTNGTPYDQQPSRARIIRPTPLSKEEIRAEWTHLNKFRTVRQKRLMDGNFKWFKKHKERSVNNPSYPSKLRFNENAQVHTIWDKSKRKSDATYRSNSESGINGIRDNYDLSPDPFDGHYDYSESSYSDSDDSYNRSRYRAHLTSEFTAVRGYEGISS